MLFHSFRILPGLQWQNVLFSNVVGEPSSPFLLIPSNRLRGGLFPIPCNNIGVIIHTPASDHVFSIRSLTIFFSHRCLRFLFLITLRPRFIYYEFLHQKSQYVGSKH